MPSCYALVYQQDDGGDEDMPETRAQRIERLENTPDRTVRQDQILAADRAYRDGVTELNELVAAWRERD